ncbi:MAG: fimbrillin family protein, partial [Bacteroidaceae bacterium]|nr:fimbrillin family protein [Bacteroidaceae bacterium]
SAPDFSITILTTEEEYTSELIPSTNWEQGRQYTYTATIKQKNIIFDEPEVAVWDKESATGSVIIK